MTHDFALFLAKTFGLFYLMGFFILIVIHTYRPSHKARADHAAQSILTTEDRPWP
ncbi:MAG: cbb3-type cytochrome oxidase subunit 3 [Cypionkella sp.]